MTMKKAILTLGVLASALTVNAQTKVCATDELYREQKLRFPGIAEQEARLKEAIDKAMYGRVNSAYAKTTADDPITWDEDITQFHIPVVVHVIYDYAAADAALASNNITDAQIDAAIAQMNLYYNRQAVNLSGIIAPFVPYIGNAHISFHLASKDPNGKPTRGVVRTYSYQTNGGDESAKIDPWDPSKYLNIYLEYKIGRGASQGIVLAYATFPTSYSDNPYSQGVISRVDQATNTISSTLSHEVGHYLFLYHPWNSNGAEVEKGSCGDDEVDDTPPTIGHFSCGTAKLYDTLCATGYYRDYDTTSYRKMTGQTVPYLLAGNLDTTHYLSSRLFNDSLKSMLGQSFTTSNRMAILQEISVFVDTAATKGGNTRMKLYDGTGTTLVATSSNLQNVFPGAKLTYSFVGVKLAPNTPYKFVVDTAGGHRSFRLKTNDTSIYAGGTLYIDSAARTAVSNTDLRFEVKQILRIDYPDTTNSQNIMDYSDCNSQMFTRGQVARMRAALRSDVGFRSNLVSAKNLLETGVWDLVNDVPIPRVDIAPTALFSVNRPFTCADGNSSVSFTNRSYNDTLSSADWTFSNGADPATTSNTGTVNVKFSTPGWVTASLTAVGTGTGSNTLTSSNSVYAADPNAIDPNGYFQEFNPGGDLDMYPIFNYYNLPDNRWEIFNGAGLFDNTSVRFRNFDTRTITIGNATTSPGGSYADLYTRAFNLNSFGSICNLSFFSAGAFRTNRPSQMTDTLEIAASTNCGQNWSIVTKISGANLGNNSLVETPFVPGFKGNWKEKSINIPTIFLGDKVFFRFRFRPGTDYGTWTGVAKGTGNHFYMDRLSISNAPLGVVRGVIVSLGMDVTPNPTSGAATISINGGDNSNAEISVTDVTGKLVFSTNVNRAAATTKIEIPASAISVKGMYLVKVVTNGATETKKLVVY